MILEIKHSSLKNARNLAGIFFTLVLFFSCAAPQTKQLVQEKPFDLAEKFLIEAVPFYPQEDFHCGPATLAMAISFYGNKVSPKDIAKDVFTPELKGSLQIEMQAAIRKQGMLAHVLTPELVYLLAEVSVGHPVIVLQNLSIKLYPIWHYALVIGYDLKNNTIILNTGKDAQYEMALSTFERTWKRSENWALVVLPTDTLPNDRNLENILQAAVDLEKVGQIKHANQAYQTITNRWPENIVAIMGAGNTFLKLNEPKQASHWYLKASDLHFRTGARRTGRTSPR